MGHPAIDISHPPGGQARVKYDTYWYHGSSLTTYSDVQTYRWLAMPETVYNPVRANGTRAPSAFWTKRVHVDLKPVKGIQVPYTSPPPAAYSYVADCVALPKAGNLLGRLKEWYFNNMFAETTQAVDARARVNFLNELADASGKDKLGLGVILGEFRETAGMAADLATSLRRQITRTARLVEETPQRVDRFLRNAQRYGVEEAATVFATRKKTRVLENIIDSWLVWQFGVKPLTHDIYDASVYIQAELLSGGTLDVNVRAGAENEIQYRKQLHNEGHQGATYNVWANMVQTTSVHYSAVYTVPVRASLSQELGLYNPALIGWELLRYSWMWDYASNMGEWIRSLTAANSTHFVEGSVSKTRKARLVDVDLETVNQPWLIDPSGQMGAIDIDDFRRDVLSSGVLPPMHPSLKNDLNVTRLANALAALSKLRF